jgi:hypothetical protein
MEISEMDRLEHLEFCKQRARKYLERGELGDAITSMLSDLSKHPETRAHSTGPLALLGMRAILSGDPEQCRRFIEGFN